MKTSNLFSLMPLFMALSCTTSSDQQNSSHSAYEKDSAPRQNTLAKYLKTLPDSVSELFNREVNQEKAFTIKAENIKFKGTTIGEQKSFKAKYQEGFAVMVWKLTSSDKSGVKCHISDDYGNELAFVTDILNQEVLVAKKKPTITYQKYSHQSQSPYFEMEAVWGEAKSAEDVKHHKIIATRSDGNALVCIHSEAGYWKSFRKAVQAIHKTGDVYSDKRSFGEKYQYTLFKEDKVGKDKTQSSFIEKYVVKLPNKIVNNTTIYQKLEIVDNKAVYNRRISSTVVNRSQQVLYYYKSNFWDKANNEIEVAKIAEGQYRYTTTKSKSMETSSGIFAEPNWKFSDDRWKKTYSSLSEKPLGTEHTLTHQPPTIDSPKKLTNAQYKLVKKTGNGLLLEEKSGIKILINNQGEVKEVHNEDAVLKYTKLYDGKGKNYNPGYNSEKNISSNPI